jgi:4-diphosphocytidyl-2-C-methyl-D-erythritol kinase
VAPPTAVRVRCPAKINLGLWILGLRPDGYHEVHTLLQSVTLEDELRVFTEGSGFSLEAAGTPIPGPGSNIVEQAYDLMRRMAGNRARGISVRLTKRIPAGGGLGGGSSDAAGFLAAANVLWGLELKPPALESLAAELGSDVPFFIRGGIAWATGRGEVVRHLCPLPPRWVVLATPHAAISTTWAYGRVRNKLTPRGGDGRMLEAATARRDWDAIARLLHNDFEDVILPEISVVGELRRAFVASGALGSLLSGSGSTVFGLASSRDHAESLAGSVRGLAARVHVVRTGECGVTPTLLA